MRLLASDRHQSQSFEFATSQQPKHSKRATHRNFVAVFKNLALLFGQIRLGRKVKAGAEGASCDGNGRKKDGAKGRVHFSGLRRESICFDVSMVFEMTEKNSG
jgi:hypothetical protein